MQKNLLVYGPPIDVTYLSEKLAAIERRSQELERVVEDSKKECETLRSQLFGFENISNYTGLSRSTWYTV